MNTNPINNKRCAPNGAHLLYSFTNLAPQHGQTIVGLGSGGVGGVGGSTRFTAGLYMNALSV